jgi:peptidoglycan L-alanyl-D-glutamate endopeptidase CwlK
MKVELGAKSKRNLSSGVDYRLVHIITEAIRRYEFDVDWGVFEAKRTIEKQREYVAKGTSKTMNSKHLPDSNGIVRAVDIVPYVNGKYDWSVKYFADIIGKIKSVASELYPNDIEFGYDWGWDAPHIEIKKGREV